MVQAPCRICGLSAGLWMSGVPQGISNTSRHWFISTCILPHDFQGKYIKSNVRIFSGRSIIVKFWLLLPNGSKKKEKKNNGDRHPPFQGPLWTEFPALSGEGSVQLFPNCTQLQLCQRTAFLQPSIVRIQKQKLPRWTSFKPKCRISHNMMLVVTRKSSDRFLEEPSQITNAWITEQNLQERKNVTEGSLIF